MGFEICPAFAALRRGKPGVSGAQHFYYTIIARRGLTLWTKAKINV